MMSMDTFTIVVKITAQVQRYLCQSGAIGHIMNMEQLFRKRLIDFVKYDTIVGYGFCWGGGGDSQVHVHKVDAHLSLKDKNGLV